MHLLWYQTSLLSIVALVTATPAAKHQGPCKNTPTSRSCWGDYDINTDYYDSWPTTGNTVEYFWTIDREILAPDGYERPVFTVNGQFPGPKLEANWGDNIVVHVTNALKDNGTSIHFHGSRQLGSVESDGAVSVTQCPIAPGESYTYRFQATQYGAGWYHSHFALQYSDGLFGPVVIHGPHSSNWDIDLGPVMMHDWFHETAFALEAGLAHESTGLPPVADNGLINGMMSYSCNLLELHDPKCLGNGKQWEGTFTPGKKHLLRLVNTGTDMAFRFSIDGHKLTVISMDYIPIIPYETDGILINIGQRYEVIVGANAKPGNYWLRSIPQVTCLAPNQQAPNVRGIIRYDPDSTAKPTSAPWPFLDECRDEFSSNLVPVVAHTVGRDAYSKTYSINLGLSNKQPLKQEWVVNSEHYKGNSSKPTLQLVEAGEAYPDGYLVTEIDLPNDQWVYFTVRSTLPVPHPFHVHGHDIYILSQGVGPYLGDTISSLARTNPVRRDTALLPAGGHLVFAFKSDNPGAWLMHCHIAWHLAEGFAMQLVTRPHDVVISESVSAGIESVCEAWREYDNSNGAVGN